MSEAPRVVLVSPKHAGNVGSSARAMKNFGLGDLWLVAPRCALDAEARALAAHAGDVLDAAVVVDTLDEAIADRTAVVGTSARRRASEIHSAEAPERALAALASLRGALVFGPEDTGLDNAALDRCQWVASIPTAPYASLNLAQAVVVMAYLWYRASHAPEPGPQPPAGQRPPQGPLPPQGPARRAQVEAMFDQLAAVALRSGYTDAARLPSAMRHLRALIDRAAPSADEVARLRGLWRHLAWALEQPPERLPSLASSSRPAASEPDDPPPP